MLRGGGRLPFDDNAFDLIISEQVLEHVMDQVGLLRELHRVLPLIGWLNRTKQTSPPSFDRPSVNRMLVDDRQRGGRPFANLGRKS